MTTIAPPTLRIAHVLGDGPFAEIGHATRVITSPDERLVAVVSCIDHSQWHGRGIESRRFNGTALHVYDTQSGRLAWAHSPKHRDCHLAWHPSGTLLVLAAGDYDGGYCFSGGLWLVRADDWSVHHVCAEPIEHVEFVSDTELELVVLARDDEEGEEHGYRHRGRLKLEDWLADVPTIGRDDLKLERIDGSDDDEPETPDAEQQLVQLASKWGQSFIPRAFTWDVRLLDDHVFACGRQCLLDVWGPDGEIVASHDAAGTCVQIEFIGGSTIVNEASIPVEACGGERPGRVWVIKQGEAPREMQYGGFQVSLGAAVRDEILLRDTADPWERVPEDVYERWQTEQDAKYDEDADNDDVDDEHEESETNPDFLEPSRDKVVSIDGPKSGDLQLGDYDLFNSYCRIRGADQHLYISRPGKRMEQSNVLSAVTPGTHEQTDVFPLVFAGSSSHVQHAFGMVHQETRDYLLVHQQFGSGWPDPGTIVRRSLDGSARWSRVMSGPVLALAKWRSHVIYTLDDGTLGGLDIETGEPVFTQQLEVRGNTVIGLSLDANDERIAVGLVDGRVLALDPL